MPFNFFSIFNCKQSKSQSYSGHPIPAQPIACHPIIRHDVSLTQKASSLFIPLAFGQSQSVCSYTHSSI